MSGARTGPRGSKSWGRALVSRRIAIVGSAGSSIALAPYADESWEIWACSPAAAERCPRIDLFFEMHDYAKGKQRWPREYVRWLKDRMGFVFMLRHEPEVSWSKPYPKDKMLETFGPNFFTSTVAWMAAMAIERHPEEIGFWGIDMSATEEYGYQRAGCHFFIREAERRGIKITVPEESDLLRPPPLYGYSELGHMSVKLETRQRELSHRLRAAQEREAEAAREKLFLQGALDDVEYMRNTWTP